MTEDDPSSTLAPEPEKTGTQPGSQTAGHLDVTLLPAASEGKGGLHESNVTDLFLAVQSQQIRDVAKLIGEGIGQRLDSADDKISRLERQLRDEEVAHARTDERLKNALVNSGRNAFLNAFGGALLGYGLSESNNTSGRLFVLTGILLIAMGCWPLWPSWKK